MIDKFGNTIEKFDVIVFASQQGISLAVVFDFRYSMKKEIIPCVYFYDPITKEIDIHNPFVGLHKQYCNMMKLHMFAVPIELCNIVNLLRENNAS